MAPPTPCWLAMRTSTVAGAGAPCASASGTHRGRLKLFHTRLPRERCMSWPSAYTAMPPMVCQRGRYRKVPSAGAAPAGTRSRYHTTWGSAVAVSLDSATLRGRLWGKATSSQGTLPWSTSGGGAAGACQPAPAGSGQKPACLRWLAPAPSSVAGCCACAPATAMATSAAEASQSSTSQRREGEGECRREDSRHIRVSVGQKAMAARNVDGAGPRTDL